MQAQPDFLDIYRSMTTAAAEMLKVALRNTGQLSEQQLQWARVALEQNDRFMNRLREVSDINDLFLAQSQFASSQLTQGIEAWWRSFRILQDSQLAAMSRVETGVGKVTKTARGTFDQAIRGWSGAERRKASVVPFSGPERRKAA
jgi:Phasin protein